MQQIKRGRRGAEGWGEVLSRFAQSGLTVQAFCDREGFSTASLYRWRSILSGAQDQGRPGKSVRVSKPARVAKPIAGFVDLGALSTGGSRFEVRLDLGGGVLLHLVRS
jgi:putative transposase